MKLTLIAATAFAQLRTTKPDREPCKAQFTCGLLQDCCSYNSECFSGCCNQEKGMCSSTDFCIKTDQRYKAP